MENDNREKVLQARQKLLDYANRESSVFAVNPIADPKEVFSALLSKYYELETSEKEFIKEYIAEADALESLFNDFKSLDRENKKLFKEVKILSTVIVIGFGYLIVRRIFKNV